MATKNKVDVTVKGKGNSSIVIGGTIGGISAKNSANNVKVNINGENLVTTVVGADIVGANLIELYELLALSLNKKSDKKGLSEVALQLGEQINTSAEERDQTKIKRLLNNLASYIDLAGFVAVQAGKAKVLYEKVAAFLA